MVKAVILDVDNTLLDFNKSACETIKRGFCELGLTYTDGILDVFLRTNDMLWRKIENKEMTREELHRVRWDIIFGKLGINADGGEMERLFLSRLEDYAIPVDGALEIVEYLAGKYKLYTASNAPYAQQVKRLTKSGIMPFIDRILNFEEQGINKPQKRFFEECLRVISPVTKDETVIIGDSLSADMKGGKNVGITTVWFNRNGAANPEKGLCDYTVTSLAEIKGIL